jgi:hypothetical protein
VLKLPLSQPKILSSFLEEFNPVGQGQDLEVLNRQFKSRIFEVTEIALTFNQTVAYANKKLEFINAYHPLITSAYLFFNNSQNKFDRTFNFQLEHTMLDDTLKIEPGDYYMGLYVLEAEKTMFGKTQKIEFLTPILYDAKEGLAVEDQTKADYVYAKSQDVSTASYAASSLMTSDEIINMRYEMEERINHVRKDFIEDQIIMIESHKDMQIKQYTEYYKVQIAHLQSTYQRHLDESQNAWSEEDRNKARKVLPIDKYNIEKMEFERDNAIATINSAKILEKEPRLISISHIQIN